MLGRLSAPSTTGQLTLNQQLKEIGHGASLSRRDALQFFVDGTPDFGSNRNRSFSFHVE